MAKKKIIPVSMRWEVIANNKGCCSQCSKSGFVAMSNGKPAILETECYKSFINVYDGTFVYKHHSMEFDHIVPESKGGPTTVKNLQILCRKCNRAKGSSHG